MSKFHRIPSFSPMMLRLALGVMFLVAGIGKLTMQEHTGHFAVQMEQMGLGRVITPSPAPATPTTTTPETPATTGEDPTPTDDAPAATNDGETTEGDGQDKPTIETSMVADDAGDTITTTDPAAGPVVEARRVDMLTVSLKDASEGNDERARLIPAAMGAKPWASGLAWAATITEIAAGGLLVVGLFTRLWALSLMWVMGVAMWLTQIGPVVMSRVPGTGVLGFLPKPGIAGDNWQTLILQFVLFLVAFALLLLGPGRMSLDAWVFGTREPRAPKGRSPSSSRYEEPASRPRRPDHPGEISQD